MAKLCDNPKCKGTDDVQKVVFMVVSGKAYQCQGDFCDQCRAALPAKMEDFGFTVSGSRPSTVKKPVPEPVKK